MFLPPATKLGQGYIFTGVRDSVHRGGSARGMSAPRGVCLLGGVSALEGYMLGGGGVCSRGGCLVETLPPGTATAAGGTQPTGMHSC